MLNLSLIERAVILANEFYEANYIHIDSRVLREQIIDWYNHTDITDEIILATAAMWIGSYKDTITLEELEKIAADWFPQEPLELQCFHIGEIENALRDAEWW